MKYKLFILVLIGLAVLGIATAYTQVPTGTAIIDMKIPEKILRMVK